MKEIYIRYPITEKIEVDDEIYNFIEKDLNGERITIDDIDYREYLWKKVMELTDDENMVEFDIYRSHEGVPVAEFCV